MAEKPPAFTVTDRRKFTVDGDLREGVSAADETAAPNTVITPPPSASAPEEVIVDAIYSAALAAPVNPSSRVVAMPSPVQTNVSPAASMAAQPPPVPPEDLQEAIEDAGLKGEMLPEPTAAESEEQHAAYRESSLHLDHLLRQQNPGMKAAAAVTIEHVVQSIYLSAVVAMGAAAEPGQKPRIDILGARQSIDMLTVLQEKTKGNLSGKEERLLQTMLFELRMMFLEITNAIAQQAMMNPPSVGKK